MPSLVQVSRVSDVLILPLSCMISLGLIWFFYHITTGAYFDSTVQLSSQFEFKGILELIPNSDHFDQKVEASLRRDIPIITTPHTRTQLTNKGSDPFTNVSALAPFETGLVLIGGTGGAKRPLLRITGMPGKHVPSNAVVGLLNKMANAVRNHPNKASLR